MITNKLALVVESEARTASNGKPFVTMRLRSESGTEYSGCKMWDCSEAPTGVIRILKGKRDEYQGNAQIIVDVWEPAGDVDLTMFEPKCAIPLNHEGNVEQYTRLLANITDLDLMYWIAEFTTYWSEHDISGEERPDKGILGSAPGARYIHHAYRHGYLQHIVEVTTHARNMGVVHGLHDREMDLLTAGCLIHDIGKWEETDVIDGVRYEDTAENKTHGWSSTAHLILGSQMLAIYFHKKPKIEWDNYLVLQNIILSHHGSFGPVPPAYQVAEIAHFADNASATINRMQLNLVGKDIVVKDPVRRRYMNLAPYPAASENVNEES